MWLIIITNTTHAISYPVQRKVEKLTNPNTIYYFANLFFVQIDTKLELSILVCFYTKLKHFSNVFSWETKP